MLAHAFAPALYGFEGRLISIECDITNGLPGFIVVGLGDKAVDESRERIRSAIKNSGFLIPPKRITLNLAPADLPKDGSGYDLAMAMAILAASGQIDSTLLEDCLFLGELGLDGQIHPVRGALSAAQLANDQHIKRLFLAPENANEASAINNVSVFPIQNLEQLYRHLGGENVLSPAYDKNTPNSREQIDPIVDFSHIYGQVQAKRAIEIATAGGHNILLSGPPGTGKTLLAKAIIGLLPKPTMEEMIEITKLHDLAGKVHQGMIHNRPFRAPHHTASSVAMIGGGTRPRPGEISLSHGGVLFLDELPEFPRSVIEVLRQPLEDGAITIARAAGVVTFPARFMLVATRNPCPCGYAGDPRGQCQCQQSTITLYQKRISGPVLDRIDLLVEVPRCDDTTIIKRVQSENSATVAIRIARARQIQYKRLSDNAETSVNAHMSTKDIQKYCKIDNNTTKIASHAIRELGLSARSYTRVLKVARTIADLDEKQHIELPHFMEALQYRPQQGNLKALRQR